MPDDSNLKPDAPVPYAVIKTDRQMSMVRFSACGKFLAAASRDATIHVWDMVLPEPPSDAAANEADKPKPSPPPVFPELSPLKGHNGWVSSIAFHPQDPRLFSADTWGQLVCWQCGDVSPKPVWSVTTAHDGWIRQLAVSPDGQSIATCGSDRQICLWASADGKLQQKLIGHADDVYSVAFHPDRKSLVSGDLKGVIKHWDLATGAVVREFDAKLFYLYSRIQDVGGVRTLAFDHVGTNLVAAGTQPANGGFVEGTPTVRFFDWASGQETQTLKVGDNTDVFVHEMAYHSRGFWMGVVSGQPGKGKFFLLRAGESQPFFSTTTLANCHSISAHPNGRRLAAISNAGTFGQARSRAREGDYPGNTSPINLWDLPELPTS